MNRSAMAAVILLSLAALIFAVAAVVEGSLGDAAIAFFALLSAVSTWQRRAGASPRATPVGDGAPSER